MSEHTNPPPDRPLGRGLDPMHELAPDELWCPRRTEGPAGRFPGPDRWRHRGGLIGQEALGPSCSFCGSLHPDRFLELVRDGWIVGPTDKTYKAYLVSPFAEQDLARARQQRANRATGRAIQQPEPKTGAEIDAHAHEEQVFTGAGPRGKFYFQHLSAAQRTEFVQLYNSRQMILGYPGVFYVRPYFCRLLEDTPESGPEPGPA